jgi:hypothetical protein
MVFKDVYFKIRKESFLIHSCHIFHNHFLRKDSITYIVDNKWLNYNIHLSIFISIIELAVIQEFFLPEFIYSCSFN